MINLVSNQIINRSNRYIYIYIRFINKSSNEFESNLNIRIKIFNPYPSKNNNSPNGWYFPPHQILPSMINGTGQ